MIKQTAIKHNFNTTKDEEVWMEFEIMGNFPTLNEILRKKNNPHAYNKMKKNLEEKARIFYRNQIRFHRYQTPLKRTVRIIFDWYVTSRAKDPDNIDAARKFLIDALVDEGVLLKDNLTIVKELESRFLIDTKNPRVRIFLCKPKYNLV